MDSGNIIFEEDDIPYEEELLRHPYTLKCWLRYIEHKKSAPDNVINMIYERALKELPGSYKLWNNYLKLRKNQVKNKRIDDPLYEEVNCAFERSLVYMHKMPVIWLEYLHFLVDQAFVTRTRRTFDRALRSLPITQNNKIWKPYLEFLMLYPDLNETILRCYRRYLKLAPEDSEEYIEYLKKADRLDEAATVLVKIINDDSFNSKHGKPKHQLWTELCDLISQNPDKISSLKVEPIIRQGVGKFTDQVGVLWNSLADYYVRSKLFEKARDVLEEAMESVKTVRDFTQVFNTYMDMQEKVVRARMEAVGELGPTQDDDLEIEVELQTLEDIMERRALLLNSVILRQNPHNVHEWHKRIKLYEGQPAEIVRTYTEAIEKVDPKQASGKYHTLWVEFARFYESANQLKEARLIFGKALNASYKTVDELAAVVCLWAEMELRHDNNDEARRIVKKAVAPVAGAVDYHDSNEPVQNRLYKSLKVWSLHADLEESFGTHLSCKSAYDRIIDLRIATPQVILNYASYLEEHNYFEESFKAYEKGINLFKWPNVNEVWNTYLVKFVARYGNKNLERTRDLFEECLKNCPQKFAKPIYLLYAKLEEERGHTSHAMNIYDRATGRVLPEEQYEMYNIYLKRAGELLGLSHTRSIYQQAIDTLPDGQAVEMCMRFADLEIKIGEIDRGRAVYAHCSQMCDPRVALDFWKTWKEFEMNHGNEDTVREMARVRRSVAASFNTQVNFMSAQMLSAQTAKRTHEDAGEADDSMKSLEKKARMMALEAEQDQPKRAVAFVRSESTTEELGELTKTNNPDEIDIADDDEEERDANNEYELEKREVPSEVFGKFIPGTD